jgi:hypothetical protein
MRLLPRLGLASPALLISTFVAAWSAQPAKDQIYQPVAPVEALARVLGGNLDLVEHWLDDKDLASADKTAQSVILLATFLVNQTGGAESSSVAKVLKGCNALGDASRAKNLAAATSALASVRRELAAFRKAPFQDHQAASPSFKPPGSTRGWMLLLDGGYADAKASRDPNEFEAQALTLAEEANVVAYLRTDARWRKMAFDARDRFLAAAQESKKDLDQARKTLRTAYPNCQSCHDANRR